MGIDGFAQPNAERATWGGRLRLGRLGALAVGIAWLAVWFCGLADRALGEPDEGRYAEVAREMLVSHDWITPQLNGFNFFDKPPLHYWATASAYMAFGVNPWSARLWCALTGLLAMAAMGWAGARLFGREAGGYAMAILGSSLLFAMGSHINTLDMGVAAFLTVGIACFLVAQFDPTAAPYRVWLNLLMWFALALAVLSKGLIGVVLPGVATGLERASSLIPVDRICGASRDVRPLVHRHLSSASGFLRLLFHQRTFHPLPHHGRSAR